MFFFKKSKPFLQDLIPVDYTDIHSHLLPSIDDGSKSIDETILLINQLKSIGFNNFITTPHVIEHVWENSKEIIEDNFNFTVTDLKENNILNSFKVAAEYMMDGNFRTIFENEKLLTLKENYVLIEMSYLNPPIELYEIIFDLQVAGYKPVLAHPERYNFYHGTHEYLKLKKSGCLFQLNLLSSVGYYGPDVARTSDYLLENNLIDYVGSDVHHSKHISYFEKKIILKNIDSLKIAFQNNSFFKI